MPVDEGFLEEMRNFIENYHKMNGADDEVARLMSNYNTYYCRANHGINRPSVCRPFKYDLNTLIDKYRIYYNISAFELMNVFYDLLKDLINEEELKKIQEINLITHLYIEEDVVKYRFEYR